jgi:hypothetical protein
MLVTYCNFDTSNKQLKNYLFFHESSLGFKRLRIQKLLEAFQCHV